MQPIVKWQHNYPKIIPLMLVNNGQTINKLSTKCKQFGSEQQ